MRKTIRALAAVMAVGMIAFGGWKLWSIRQEYKISRDLYTGVAEQVLVRTTPAPGAAAEKEAGPTPGPGAELPVVIDFETLLAMNGDVVGWLYEEDSHISYPVVQGTDNDFYVERLLDHSWSAAGTLFADHQAAPDFSSLNTVIYGHNMMDGSMMAFIKEYEKQSYYDEHPALWLFTPTESFRLEVFAGFVTNYSEESYQIFGDTLQMREYLQSAAERSDFTSRVDPESIERIVTLSTCSYEYTDARYVLVCSLVKVE